MYLSVNPYQELLEGMSVALQVNEGILKLTGPDGSGKSALCRELVRRLQEQGRSVLYLEAAPPGVDALQLAILQFLELPAAGNFTRQLTRHLQQLDAERAVLHVIIDEAQDLDEPLFESIRMLCNIQDQHRSLVKPILCGSPELDRRMAGIRFRSVSQYLSQSFVLRPMTPEQVGQFYWSYWQQRQIPVEPAGTRLVGILVRESRGLPGPVLARLELAHQRVIERREARGEREQDPAVGIEELSQPPAAPRRRLSRALLRLALAGLLVLTLTAGWLWYGHS